MVLAPLIWCLQQGKTVGASHARANADLDCLPQGLQVFRSTFPYTE